MSDLEKASEDAIEQRKAEMHDEIRKIISELYEDSQVRDLAFWWWSSQSIQDRIIEEMDEWWLRQQSIEDVADTLEHVKKIRDGKVVDISQE